MMPAFLQPLDFEKAREELTANFSKIYQEKSGQTYEPLIADDIQILINCFLYYLGKAIDNINHTIANNFLEYSSGAHLDALVALLGLKRYQREFPTAKLNIVVKAPVFLPKNTKFASADGAIAWLSVDTHLKPGEGGNIVQVLGDKEGDWQTDILENANPLVLKIEVVSPFVNLQDLESDEALRERFKLSLASFSTAGSVQSYTHFASIKGVGKIKVISLKPGEVTIYYTNEQNLDAPALIKEAIKDKTPLTDKVIIELAQKIETTLDYTISLKVPIDANAYIKDLEKRAKDLFKSLAIGQNPSQNKLESLAFSTPEVLDVNLPTITPANTDQWLYLQAVHVSLEVQA
ncbi:baseplate assembly protein J, putative [Helicobacter bizzozeronii CIII-1]|uniref:Baseplate assembly protein J, putative n=2 Tax=Helicobacter bizzozeronii TaxID=56877 RepID=F8KPM6_HELBC|nr:baseplate assembly protein J, putative [Helicobacter bizzozeronii CIII-1]